MTELLLDEERLPVVLARLIEPTSNVVDVGCHIGSFLSTAMRLAPKGQHCGIEASPSKAALLKRKFPKVRIEQTAVSDFTGSATFEDNVFNPGFSKLQGDHPTRDPVTRYEVQVTTLDLLTLGTVHLLKLDIEGSELAALKGAADLISGCRPKIVFECGADSNAGLDRRALFDHLTATLQYNVFTFSDFLFDKGPLTFDEFRKCGVYPFRAFNFIALPGSS